MAEERRTAIVSMAGALGAAVGASFCCWGPMLFAAFGLGGLGVFARAAAYRSALLAATAVFLGIGLYVSYRTKPFASRDACGCSTTKATKLSGRVLLLATTGTLFVSLAPSILALAASWHREASPLVSDGVATFHVDGIDCEACASPMRKALAAAGGFAGLTLDVARQTITVSYVRGAGRPQVYVSALDRIGYDATLSSASDPEVRRR